MWKARFTAGVAVAVLIASSATIQARSSAAQGGTAVATPSPTPAPDPAADQALGRTLLLQIADVPGGRAGSPPSAEDNASDKEVDTCVGLDQGTVRAGVDGPSIDVGDASVDSKVYVLQTAEQARTTFDGFQSRLPGCFVRTSERLARTGTDDFFTKVQFFSGTIPVDNLGSDRAARPAFVVVLGKEKIAVAVFADIVMMQSGRAIVVLSFVALNPGFDIGLEGTLIAKVGSRMKGI